MQVTIMIQNLSLNLNILINLVKLKSELKRIQAQYIFIVQNMKAMIVVLMAMLIDAIIMIKLEANVRVTDILYIMVPCVK